MLQDILKALESNPTLASEVESIYKTNEANVNKIGELEVKTSTLGTDLKGFKDMVRSVTGLTELSEANLTRFADGADEGLKADNQTLQSKLEELTSNYNGLEGKHETEISTMILKDKLRSLGVDKMTKSDFAFNIIAEKLQEEAVREGKKFTFKDGDKTMFGDGGKELDEIGRVSQLKDGDYGVYFNEVKGAGGGQEKASPTVQSNHDKGSVAYIKDKFL